MQVDRNVNAEFKFNQESEFIPIAALIDSQLNATPGEGNKTERTASSIQDNHHPAILALLASELSVAPEEIHDFELYVVNYTLILKWFLRISLCTYSHLYDVQPSQLGGLNDEFIFSPRMDNLFSS